MSARVKSLLDLVEIINCKITDAEGKLRSEMCFTLKIKGCGFFKSMGASFIDKILPYHVYLLVPLLCSGDADNFSQFSLLSCFHGLLDRSTREEAEVRTELMKLINWHRPEKWHICLGVCNSFKQNKTKLKKRTLKMTEFAFIMYEALASSSELI